MQRIADRARERLKTLSTSASLGRGSASVMKSNLRTAHSAWVRSRTEVGAAPVWSTPRGYVAHHHPVQPKLRAGSDRRHTRVQACGADSLRHYHPAAPTVSSSPESRRGKAVPTRLKFQGPF